MGDAAAPRLSKIRLPVPDLDMDIFAVPYSPSTLSRRCRLASTPSCVNRGKRPDDDAHDHTELYLQELEGPHQLFGDCCGGLGTLFIRANNLSSPICKNKTPKVTTNKL
jgi:hypothetical protein